MSKLDERMKQYGIPPIPGLPMGKTILVFRIPPVERTAGGLYIPETDQGEQEIGVLLAAGLGAIDILKAALIEIGDVIWFGRFAGTNRTVRREAAQKAEQITAMKVEDVQISVDALERLKGYDIKELAVEGEPTGQHFYVPKKKGK
ncbi:MAG TPA: co-chaperone GroES family protein [Tepidiformaceae bacterium]|jgi:co-chaperonin GroES (HSP10)|nr:co-chaperone GroES family protein [Tepidiformaceae bacterium]